MLSALDAASDRLLRPANPKAGTCTGTSRLGIPFGPLGFAFTTDNAVGFDIPGKTGIACANIDSLLWTTSLVSGAGTAFGIIGPGPVRSIAFDREARRPVEGDEPEPGDAAVERRAGDDGAAGGIEGGKGAGATAEAAPAASAPLSARACGSGWALGAVASTVSRRPRPGPGRSRGSA
ncbi:hypothetical protein [Thermaurantiacus sp.]